MASGGAVAGSMRESVPRRPRPDAAVGLRSPAPVRDPSVRRVPGRLTAADRDRLADDGSTDELFHPVSAKCVARECALARGPVRLAGRRGHLCSGRPSGAGRAHGEDPERDRPASRGADRLRVRGRLRSAAPPGAGLFRSERHVDAARWRREWESGARRISSAASCLTRSWPPRRSPILSSTPGRGRRPAGARSFPAASPRSCSRARSAFAKEDAMKAGQGLLERGAVRVKPGAGIAGLGQSVVDTVADLAARDRRDRARRRCRRRAWSSSRISPTSRPTASARSAWRTASARTTARRP